MQVICDLCRQSRNYDPIQHRCTCGGAWEPLYSSSFNPDSIALGDSSLWRYRDLLQIPEIENLISLGAGWTPLVDSVWDEKTVHFKLEFFSPTGSFKDRGTEVEVNYLEAVGVSQVVEDSSGNAGASLAAYAARSGLQAHIYAPESASPAKLAQIQVYGAVLHKIPGARSEATRAALNAVALGGIYASHAYNPYYLLGQQTFAWEIWEQLGRKAPDALVIPVGQGGLLMGAWLGFERLLQAGLISSLPRLYAIQPQLLAPIRRAFQAGKDDIDEWQPTEKSLAEGLAIIKPVRSRRILQALRESKGGALTVTEAEICQAYDRLARMGIFAEPSSAVAAAALPQVRQLLDSHALIVTALTGSGLKAPIFSPEV